MQRSSALLCALLAILAMPGASAWASCDGQWAKEQMPDPPTGTSRQAHLGAVDATSQSNAWAVGTYGAYPQSLAIHWNGTDWRARHVDGSSRLDGVAVLSPRNSWFVGTGGSGSTEHATITHRQGKRWTRMTLPLPPGWSGLGAIDGPSADEMVAVGQQKPGVGLAYHWDGSAWTTFDIPDTYGLWDVVDLGPDDLWIAGIAGKQSLDVWHWDGTAWTLRTPSVGDVWDIASDGQGGIWASGESWEWGAPGARTFAQHWNGTDWEDQPPLNPGTTASWFSAIAVDPVLGVIGVGGISGTETTTLAERFDGGWSTMPTPDVGTNPKFYDVAIAGNRVWAVGSDEDFRPVLESVCFP